MKLIGKTALVTGGAMGIGKATTIRLLKKNCKVTVWDINSEAIEKLKSELSDFKDSLFIHEVDVTDKERVYHFAKITKEQMGKVDILVNNAGYVMGGDFLEKEDSVWEKTIDINLTSMIYTIRAFLPEMYERNSGAIVNISSASSTIGVPNLAIYTATKWAVWGLTESMRFEALNRGKSGVKWSSIHPSYIAEGLFAGAKLGLLGNLIVPILKNHDIIAKAIVESAIERGNNSPKRPRTVNLTLRLRAFLPDKVFQWLLILLGIPGSMKSWIGRKN